MKDMERIAVVGIGCRFPGAKDPAAYWDLLTSGRSAIRDMPEGRWSGLDHQLAPHLERGGFLEEVSRFDAGFFGISPREAREMDPQQRLMLELAWESLEQAGTRPHSLRKSRVGVFFGAMWHDYALHAGLAVDAIDQHTATGLDSSILAARVSHFLDLRGPSMTVNTACSSSLVALHLACGSLRTGETSLALTGGVNLILAPQSTVSMARFGGLSRDATCRAFDARGGGYVRGEGGGILVLKRLSDATRDGDVVHAVIVSSAVNSDGRGRGLTVPDLEAQVELLEDAYRFVDPRRVHYVEAHGTGTKVGDPIEAHALGAVLGRGRDGDDALRLGSVKTNIGHLEAAAGAASLIKVILALRHRCLPATLNFRSPSPDVDFGSLGLRMQTKAEPWPEGRLLAGVSGFGFGGTNAHVVLEGSSADHRSGPEQADGPLVLTLSAHTAEALTEYASRYVDPLARSGSLRGTLARASGRTVFPHRAVLVSSSREALLEGVGALARGDQYPGLCRTDASREPGGLVFVYSGHGSQWPGMCLDLLESEPAFAAAMARCDLSLRRQGFGSILEILGSYSAPLPADIVQALLFGAQVSFTALLASWGIEPRLVMGHSVGEIAAAHASGQLDLDTAARVVVERSRAIGPALGRGTMVLVELPGAAAEEAIAGRPTLSVAVYQSPRFSVISGDRETLGDLVESLTEQGIFCRWVDVDYASHGPQMAPLARRLELELTTIQHRAPQVPMVSTTSGGPAEGLDSAYWARNLKDPVLLHGAIEHVLSLGHRYFLEVSPHSLLGAPLAEIGAAHGATVAATSRRRQKESLAIRQALGQLFVAGYPVDWTRIAPPPSSASSELHEDLPTFPFQRTRYWKSHGQSSIAATPPPSRMSEPEEAPPPRESLKHRLASASGESRRAHLQQFVAIELARVLRSEAASLPMEARFESLGLDSLMALELRSRIEAHLELTVPTSALWGHPTVAGFTGYLEGRVQGSPPVLDRSTHESNPEKYSRPSELGRIVGVG